MNKPNQPDVETTTTTCTSCNKYPRKNYRLYPLDIEKLDFSGVEEMEKKNFEFLQKLGTPLEYKPDSTIEEVKKEWEDDGYVWVEKRTRAQLEIHLLNTASEIIIYTGSKMYECIDRETDNLVQPLTLQEHVRLTKTFRALRWFNE